MVGKNTDAGPVADMVFVSTGSRRVFVRFAGGAVYASTASAGATARIVAAAAYVHTAE
jgi:hypothetical protein